MNRNRAPSILTVSFIALVAFAIAVSQVAVAPSSAQEGSSDSAIGDTLAGPKLVYRADPGDANVRIPRQTLASSCTPTANLIVVYSGFSAQALAAFQTAVDIWACQISSSVPIRISATWTSLDQDVLGQAGPTSVRRNFTNAPLKNTWYPNALANKLAGFDLAASEDDIDAEFNSSFSAYYLGTDGNPPSGKYDFVSVVLHELGHGLGFSGSMNVVSSVGSWGYGTGTPFIYDRFTVNGSTQSLINTLLFPNPSVGLGQQLTGGAVFFNGPNAMMANNGQAPRLYAPSTWKRGSSYSHLDESTFPKGGLNSLMTPGLSSAEAIRDPGPLTRGIFKDMGWTVNDSPAQGAATSTPTTTITPTATKTLCPSNVCTPTPTPVKVLFAPAATQSYGGW